MADDRGIRGNAYDPEGADSVVGQRGRGTAAAIHSQPLRDCRVTPRQNFGTAVSIAALLFATDPLPELMNRAGFLLMNAGEDDSALCSSLLDFARPTGP